jgi:UDP-3-O-[3-hydroxymyristoyl] glucosamine N-acyltransferase
VERPRLALARAIAHFRTKETLVPGIQAGASVDPEAIVDPAARIEAGARILAGARVGAGTLVEHGAVLYAGAEVGKDCVIGTHAVVREGCILGDRVRLDCGVVIGSDGFGFVTEGDTHSRIPQVGNVVVGDDVEIGANSTVDRATLGSTRIGAGSKIDNQVQVGHNVTIGKDVIIAAQVGLSGSVRIGDGVLLGGQVGVADHVVIEAGAQVGAKSGVGSRVPEGSRVAGYPAVPVRQWLQNIFLLRKLRRRMKPDSQRGNS